MPQQDYYSKWLSALSGGVEKKDKEKEKPGPKDYYAGWSAKLAKEPKEGKHSWTKELLPSVLESSPFLAKIAAASGNPMLAPIAEATLPERKKRVDVGKAGANLLKQVDELGQATGMPSSQSVEKHFADEKAGKQRAKAAVEIVTSGGKLPMPPPKEKGSIGKTVAGVAKGGLEVGKGMVNFIPELVADFLYDPAKTIEERPADLLFMAEGYLGPKVRFRVKSVMAKKKAGTATRVDIDNLAKAVAEEAPKIEQAVAQGPSAEGGRGVKGLGVQMVDDSGKPISMTEYLRNKRGVKAAEDFIVATTGKVSQKPAPAPPVDKITTGPVGPKEELLKRISQAKTMTGPQKKIISAERGQRLAAFEAATEGLTGVEKTRAFDKHFAGKHTRIQYDPFIEKLTPDVIDGLHAMVWDSKNLGKFEKRSTVEGLTSIMLGQQPQKAQLEKLTRVFGSELVDALLKHSSSTEKLVRLMVDVGNIPRSLMASLDLSAPFRQGIVMISRPKQFFPAMGKMIGYFGSDEAYHALLKDIVARPTYSLMRRGGLSITEVGGALGKAEEMFASRLANKIPGVKPSARAYTGFLDKLRADVFDDLVSKAIRSGLDPHNNDDLIKSIASFVNTATGRGDIKAFNRAATLMNSFFFSPRLAYSRLQMMNPFWYKKLDPFARKEAIKTVLSSMGVGAVVAGAAKMAGFDVSLNPRTADFLKIKRGNTRLDIFGGTAQYWRLFLNLGDIMLQRVGVTEKDKRGASGLDRIHRFIEAKEAPVASLATDILRGKTYLGEELRLDRMAASRLIPMIGQDLYDAIKDNPEDLAMIALVFGSGMLGVGAQTYETDKKKPKRMY